MKDWMQHLGIAIIAVLAPIQAVMITVGVLVLGDLITGVAAAIKKSEHISSARLRDTVSKALVYQVAVISGFLVESYLMPGTLPVSKLIAGAIGLAELKSILENLNMVVGTDLFSQLIKKLGSANSLPKDDNTP